MTPPRPFTPEEREALRVALVEAARVDPRIVAAAHTGSAAVRRLDRWSDIDFALCVSDETSMEAVISDWTVSMQRQHDAIAYHDVRRGNTLFRVFLTRNSLQVDLAFWPQAEFGATSPTFQLVFGTATDRPPIGPPSPAELIGVGWLYALHVRSSIARGRLWQAEYMLSAVRDQVLALACLRHGLNPRDARGVDDLPTNVRASLLDTFIGTLDPRELRRAFSRVLASLLSEARYADSALADRLTPTLELLDARF